jgi:hypothetical protein
MRYRYNKAKLNFSAIIPMCRRIGTVLVYFPLLFPSLIRHSNRFIPVQFSMVRYRYRYPLRYFSIKFFKINVFLLSYLSQIKKFLIRFKSSFGSLWSTSYGTYTGTVGTRYRIPETNIAKKSLFLPWDVAMIWLSNSPPVAGLKNPFR